MGFLVVLVGVFGYQKRGFPKTLCRVDIFESVALLLLCERVKAELFENSDATALIYHLSEHLLRLDL